MNRFFLLTVCLISIVDSPAQNKYPVSAIPSSLLTNANVVKRMEDIRFEVRNLHDAVYTHKYALTILNEAGQRYAQLEEDYDRLHKIVNIEGALYDAAGNQLKKVKAKDISDYSNTGDNLYDDDRVKTHNFTYKSFPYTVEYEVETAYNHTFYFPEWVPQSSEYVAVEQSAYTFVSPEAYTLRYKAFNYGEAPVPLASRGKKEWHWQVKNLGAISRPFASPRWNELTTAVFFAPSQFEIEGYQGNSSSWEDLGKFQLLLNADRDKLPADVIQKAMQLTAGITDKKEKVKLLYDYFQQHTRYISVQLGVGGWQPFDAGFVAQKGYGDCKALSNYMYSLLKAVGIKSYYTKIHAGESADDKYMMEDFPSNQSNHIVLCVPLTRDTMWLECTSQTVPPGYMGKFTGNRKALLVTEDGGRLVPTPRYTASDNLQQRFIKGTITTEGTLSFSVNTIYKGEQQDRLSGMVNYLSKEEVKKRLNQDFNFSSYNVGDFSYTPKKALLPEMAESLNIDVTNYATVSGRRLFILPNVMTRDGWKAIDTAGRIVDYVFDNAYCDIDTVELAIPAGYVVEMGIPDISLKTKYGNYTCQVKIEGEKLVYYRRMERWPGRYPAKEGGTIAGFYTTVYKADRSRVVLVKKE